ncbi:NAD-dependent epimerase/dehydratase family protein [Streptomyces sp. Ncost-T10-10d]|uniref:NAD-dependent epimerase/dehydratase family protein n=1 Tax=Streptomyces sp. Ncost-T10-10d TaxID=1839774 RepID=UPI001C402FF0|nr:NAD-dependent epimerase/dehydratase family protein [Streptomyces sp. Ncost-T10-10d]
MRTVVQAFTPSPAVRRLAADADAVITSASPGDQYSGTAGINFSEAAIEGLREGGTFIHTSGIWVYGNSDQITEESTFDASTIVAWHPEADARLLAAPGVRSTLIEPAIVYGYGKGIPNVVTAAEQTGDAPVLQLVGPGTQHWTTVHVDDLAELYVAVLERCEAGHRYVGASGVNPTVRELGEAASRRRGLEGRVAPETAAATTERLGAFGEALLLDQPASGQKAREVLGWKPSRPSLVEEIAAGHYDQP